MDYCSVYDKAKTRNVHENAIYFSGTHELTKI